MTAGDVVDEVLAALAEADPHWALRMLSQALDAWRRVAHGGTPEQQEAWLTEPARLDELPHPWRVLVAGVVAEWAERWGHVPPAWTEATPLPAMWSPLGHQPGDRWWRRAEERPVPGLLAWGVLLEATWFETA